MVLLSTGRIVAAGGDDAVADRGADWPVVLLSFSTFTFCFFFSSASIFLLFPVFILSLPLWSSQMSPGAAARR
jgi:hypothetical protein